MILEVTPAPSPEPHPQPRTLSSRRHAEQLHTGHEELFSGQHAPQEDNSPWGQQCREALQWPMVVRLRIWPVKPLVGRPKPLTEEAVSSVRDMHRPGGALCGVVRVDSPCAVGALASVRL